MSLRSHMRMENIRPDDVHLWYVFTDGVGSSFLDRYAEIVSREELERADRFVFEKDRRSSLISWALVRTTLSRYSTICPTEWRFRRGKYGKPEIGNESDGSNLRFNLSHTAGLSACAVHLENDIGVDVEYLERRSATSDIARRSFAVTEFDELLQHADAARKERFFDYWTLKEAYIKAVGQGISLGLQEFAFDLSDAGRPSIRFSEKLNDDPADWTFIQDRPGPVHRAAVAVRVPAQRTLDLTIRSVVPLQ